MKHNIIYIAPFLGLLLCCEKNSNPVSAAPVFDSVPISKPLTPLVNEISGIADSHLNPGYLWGEEDSGNPTQLYLIKHDGTVARSIYLKGITNRDWEDMCLFNNQIYIAETGDNAQVYSGYRFYRFAEPSIATDTVQQIETISFTYPDGSHDCEAFMIDPATKNIYLITKRDNFSRVYRLSYPYGANNVVSLVTTLPYTGVVGASVSADGKEILIKTYTSIYYYKLTQQETMEQGFRKNYKLLPYQMEPQGEAVSFAEDGSGFYTISEKAFSSTVNLYFYKRN